MKSKQWYLNYEFLRSLGVSKNRGRSLAWQLLKQQRDLKTFKNPTDPRQVITQALIQTAEFMKSFYIARQLMASIHPPKGDGFAIKNNQKEV